MKPVSLKSALTVSIKAARAAGKVMRDNWHKPKKVNLAEAHDIKLELDVRCQGIIEKTLAKAIFLLKLKSGSYIERRRDQVKCLVVACQENVH